jgi:hypothetical protein
MHPDLSQPLSSRHFRELFALAEIHCCAPADPLLYLTAYPPWLRIEWGCISTSFPQALAKVF